MRFKDLRVGIQKVSKKLKRLKRHERKGLSVIFIGFLLVTLSLIFVPLMNSERVWKKNGSNNYVTIQQNYLTRNKYEVIVSYSGFMLEPLTGSITFKHFKTGTTYTFDYKITWKSDYTSSVIGLSDIYYARKTFKMLSGVYSISISRDIPDPIDLPPIQGGGYSYELFEKGIIPKYSDLIVYLTIISGSLVLMLLGCRKYKGWLPRKFVCQNCGEKLLIKTKLCRKCWEKSFLGKLKL